MRDSAGLGRLIGRRAWSTVTQHDQDEWIETHQASIWLHFDDGTSVKFPIGDAGFEVDTFDDEGEDGG